MFCSCALTAAGGQWQPAIPGLAAHTACILHHVHRRWTDTPRGQRFQLGASAASGGFPSSLDNIAPGKADIQGR